MENIREEIKREENSILRANLENYRIEALDSIDALNKVKTQSEKDMILKRLWNMVLIYRRYNQGSRPPKLLRFKNEPTDDYLERCCKAGHYLCATTILNQLDS